MKKILVILEALPSNDEKEGWEPPTAQLGPGRALGEVEI